MKIQVLGTGCPKCKALAERVERAVAELGLDCDIEKITDIREIMAYGVMITPALAVDGEVKMSGKLPSVVELMEVLTA
ncbi:MAG: TM0996/MTH895 family glutaredoxin-like protein [Candidatus Eisenbacteria bacterium]|nr:TM0996/MTH895 family glutaredoxin-like protein [Candidatus Eisenbacteria bacterium]